MAHILIEKSHTLPIEQVKKMLEETFMEDLEDFDIFADWNGNVCELKGKGAHGAFRVDASKVVFELTTSILSRTGGTDPAVIEEEVRSRLQKLLH
ncbi:MAG: polyhydroxyalkanoic acid system family protein [Pseudomonadota bacterium]